MNPPYPVVAVAASTCANARANAAASTIALLTVALFGLLGVASLAAGAVEARLCVDLIGGGCRWVSLNGNMGELCYTPLPQTEGCVSRCFLGVEMILGVFFSMVAISLGCVLLPWFADEERERSIPYRFVRVEAKKREECQV